MKKSKVLIPAMALLLFSTAASITGTVAWFTSNRIFNTSAGTFTATAIDGNLDVELTGGVATGVYSGDGADAKEKTEQGFDPANAKIVVESGAKFADTSFMPKPATGDSTFWRYTPTGSTTFTSLGLTSTGLTYSTGVYFAASWTITFNYDFGEDSTPMNIFLDTTTNGSGFTHSDSVDSNKAHQAIKGFRIAFISTTNNVQNTVIWADKQENSKCKHITSTSSDPAGVAYTEPNTSLITATAADRDSALAIDGATASGFKGYIGQIPTPSGSATRSSLTVTCYAWFEGTDENIVNGAQLNICSASMKFYARTAPVSTPSSGD